MPNIPKFIAISTTIDNGRAQVIALDESGDVWRWSFSGPAKWVRLPREG